MHGAMRTCSDSTVKINHVLCVPKPSFRDAFSPDDMGYGDVLPCQEAAHVCVLAALLIGSTAVLKYA